jgi:hypothetical protein
MAGPSKLSQYLQTRDLTEWVTILEALEANGKGSEPAFIVNARFLDGKDEQELGDMARGRGGPADIDTKRYRKLRSRRLVLDWTGLTVGNLKRLCPKVLIKNEQEFLSEFGEGNEIKYSEDMALFLYDHTLADDYIFPIVDALKDASKRHEEETAVERAEQEGNSGGSSISGSR